MPRELVPVSHANSFGAVHVERDTSYKPVIATCFRSNHDITQIPTNAKAQAHIYYLANYTTKADISPQREAAIRKYILQVTGHEHTVSRENEPDGDSDSCSDHEDDLSMEEIRESPNPESISLSTGLAVSFQY